ncbi:hypothetical protein AX15_007192 [Amanita polypyramis BW_CC]|nr:hypothetical protein AX15_007192 [Amanita polypyramis BW_CC]
MQKLTYGLSPYSKSHTRRLKRKANEQIAGGLSDIKAAITELAEESNREQQDATSMTKLKVNSRSGKIGEGKSVPLTAPQRKRALQLEQMRQPLVLSNPAFALNPFQAVRTHAENTLVKRQVPIL